jgi:hypothetical protein
MWTVTTFRRPSWPRERDNRMAPDVLGSDTSAEVAVPDVGTLVRRRDVLARQDTNGIVRLLVQGQHGAVGVCVSVYLGPLADNMRRLLESPLIDVLQGPDVTVVRRDSATGLLAVIVSLDLAVHSPRPRPGAETLVECDVLPPGRCYGSVDAAAAALLLHRWDQAGGDDEVVYRALTARYLADLAGVPDG